MEKIQDRTKTYFIHEGNVYGYYNFMSEHMDTSDQEIKRRIKEYNPSDRLFTTYVLTPRKIEYSNMSMWEYMALVKNEIPANGLRHAWIQVCKASSDTYSDSGVEPYDSEITEECIKEIEMGIESLKKEVDHIIQRRVLVHWYL